MSEANNPAGVTKRVEFRKALPFFYALDLQLNRRDHERRFGMGLARASNPAGVADAFSYAL
jgi:hypothetical protein